MTIFLIITVVLFGVIVFLGIKSFNKLTNKYNLLDLKYKRIKADRARLEIALENIELIRRTAKDEKKKIDAADDSVIASVLNDLLCVDSGS